MMFLPRWTIVAAVLLFISEVVTYLFMLLPIGNSDELAEFQKEIEQIKQVSSELETVTSNLKNIKEQNSKILSQIRTRKQNQSPRMMFLPRWTIVAAVLLFISEVVTYLFMLLPIGNSDELAEFQKEIEQIKQVSSELETVTSNLKNIKEQNSKILSQIRTRKQNQSPMKDYESLRKRIYSNTKELWYFMHREIRDAKTTFDSRQDQFVLDGVAERKRALLSDQEKLPLLDGYQEWRSMEAADVSDLVQRRLHYLQNPRDCYGAKKITCFHNYANCGFGCQLHHLAFCLIVAYATQRTLVLQKEGWVYNTYAWDEIFYPLSNTCVSVYNDTAVPWTESQDAKVVSLPVLTELQKKPEYIVPLAIPKDLAHRIVRFNGDPPAWWIGQIIKYILKPRPSIQKAIDDKIAKKKDFKVGMHIRRIYKNKNELSNHIKEYMDKVEDYFLQLELTRIVDQRRVYLATDDEDMISDVRRLYPKYKIFGNPSIAETAKELRYTPQSLTGVLMDLYMLATCDFVVCNFSSNFARAAYEVMQTIRVDASGSFFSMDLYRFYSHANRIAVLNNLEENIEFVIGDVIGVQTKNKNGFGYGTNYNMRNNMTGLFPWYKTVEHLALYPFPKYKQTPT